MESGVPMEASTLQRGDIVIERLTGQRAMVIRVVSAEEVTCRFVDGRLEDRFSFELGAPLSVLGWLAFLVSSFQDRLQVGSSTSVPDPAPLRLIRTLASP